MTEGEEEEGGGEEEVEVMGEEGGGRIGDGRLVCKKRKGGNEME